jgi:diguanylate cyclase (GGDEF)-like protein
MRAHRYGRRLALLILDLDDFKAVNDSIGHLAGDSVLALVAERLRDQVRSVDIGCRIGGDEFAVILPESTAADAEQLFERMHNTVRGMTTPGGRQVRISAGIAELHHGETAAELFERADAALYRAKDLGKDRASVAPD